MRRSPPRPAGFICHLCAPKPLSAAPSLLLLPRSSLPPAAHDPSTARPRARCLPLIQVSQRWSSTSTAAAAPPSTSTTASPAPNTNLNAHISPAATTTTTTTTNASSSTHPDPLSLAAIAEDSAAKFLSVPGIPAPQLTLAALQSCLRAASSLHPHLKRAEAHASASASRLSQLGAERLGTRPSHLSPHNIPAPLSAASARISRAALSIIAHDAVDFSPALLDAYVRIHAHLGRPEPLPHILHLYAHKPKPALHPSTGALRLSPRSPNSPSRAIDPDVAHAALQTAIDARNLDAALAIIDAAYCVPAFKRHKLVKHASAPALALASLPFGIFGLSSAYAAYWQNTMDMATATGIAVAGISGYFFVVGSLGLIAKLSYKDQMKRVTWTPGTPLRYRWLREDERAALDRVACAWGFREPWRHGEETGPEWEGLKEYMGYRGMLLDRVEFMEGMN